MKAVMYGAGSIGRGFIGALLSEIGYEVIFVDVNDKVIRTMNEEKKYPQIIMQEKQEVHWITNIRAVDGKDEEAAAREISDADLMAVAVGANILPKIAPIIANGLHKRWKKDPNRTLDILICENLMDANVLLEGWVKEALPKEDRDRMKDLLGLVETSIGRMVPPANQNQEGRHFLEVRVEAYDFLPVDKAAFKGEIPNYSKIVPYAPFHYYLERKLYIHNMAHALTAFLGQLHGYKKIEEAICDLGIRKIVQGAMTESAMMLSKRYQVGYWTLQEHIDDLLMRFQNPYLEDTTERVARDPVRKLKPKDRLVGAARACEQEGILPVHLSFAIAAGLCYMNPEKPEELMQEISLISPEEPLGRWILDFYKQMKEGKRDLGSYIKQIDCLYTTSRGEIV